MALAFFRMKSNEAPPTLVGRVQPDRIHNYLIAVGAIAEPSVLGFAANLRGSPGPLPLVWPGVYKLNFPVICI